MVRRPIKLPTSLLITMAFYKFNVHWQLLFRYFVFSVQSIFILRWSASRKFLNFEGRLTVDTKTLDGPSSVKRHCHWVVTSAFKNVIFSNVPTWYLLKMSLVHMECLDNVGKVKHLLVNMNRENNAMSHNSKNMYRYMYWKLLLVWGVFCGWICYWPSSECWINLL